MIHHSQPTTHNLKLIATDIDGTLLNSANMLPLPNKRAIEQALAQGVRLALVTARKRSSAQAVARLLDVPCACIAHNGARIWDWEQRELRHLVVDLALAREIAQFADHHALPLVVTINEVNYYSATYPFDPRWQQPDERIVASLLDVITAPPTRIIAAGSAGVDALCTMFGAAPDMVVVHRYFSRDGALESAVLTHPRATKADALAELIHQIDLQPAQVLALGDAEADAGMLRWAGVGVAMGNAMPEARAAADWIAPSHDQAGFAAAIERFILNPHMPVYGVDGSQEK